MRTRLLITVDSGTFKAYRMEDSRRFSHPRLQLLENWQTEASRRISEQVTDQAGQFSKGSLSFASINDMADGERHNLALEHRRRAIKSMAVRIGALLRGEAVARCYLAAPRGINEQLLDALEPWAREQVEKNITADLTRLNPLQIISFFCKEEYEAARSH